MSLPSFFKKYLNTLVINLVGAYVPSAKYTRRGVKVVYLGAVITGASLWVTGSSRGPVEARVMTQWRKVMLQWPQPPIIQLPNRVEYISHETRRHQPSYGLYFFELEYFSDCRSRLKILRKVCFCSVLYEVWNRAGSIFSHLTSILAQK